MGSVTEIVLAFMDLMEAEARALRQGTARLVLSLVILAVVGILLVTGFGFLVWSLYLYLRLVAEAPLSALLAGLLTFVLAGVLLWNAKRLVR